MQISFSDADGGSIQIDGWVSSVEEAKRLGSFIDAWIRDNYGGCTRAECPGKAADFDRKRREAALADIDAMKLAMSQEKAEPQAVRDTAAAQFEDVEGGARIKRVDSALARQLQRSMESNCKLREAINVVARTHNQYERGWLDERLAEILRIP